MLTEFCPTSNSGYTLTSVRNVVDLLGCATWIYRKQVARPFPRLLEQLPQLKLSQSAATYNPPIIPQIIAVRSGLVPVTGQMLHPVGGALGMTWFNADMEKYPTHNLHTWQGTQPCNCSTAVPKAFSRFTSACTNASELILWSAETKVRKWEEKPPISV